MPCAGLSTRFPNLRPKYLLTDYNGKLMIENAAKNFIDKYRVTVVILEEHDKKFNARQKLNDAFGYKIDIIILDKPTTGPADTVYQAIKRGRINTNSPILIKDCDGFYDADIVDGNAIYVSKLSKNPDIRNAPAKSYTITNEQNIITTVVEKQIVSKTGKKSKDGIKIRTALGQKNIKDTLRAAILTNGGVKGHTFIADPNHLITIEMTSKHKPVIKLQNPSKTYVRTNHGLAHPDAGYTEGPDYKSSVIRRASARAAIGRLKNYNLINIINYNLIKT